jgi:hypothetical protein
VKLPIRGTSTLGEASGSVMPGATNRIDQPLKGGNVMKVLVRLDLSRYCVDTLKTLYRDGILTRDEFYGEVLERGCHEWIAIQLCREVEGSRAS